MRVVRPGLTVADLAFALPGAAATLLASYLAVRLGAEISVGLLLVIGLFLVAIIGFVGYPHIAVAATIVFFSLIPALKVLATPEIGVLKDLIVVAAISAAVIVRVSERCEPDRWIVLLVGLLLGLYVINVGGGHGIGWVQGARLVGEPLLLLVVGLMLPQPRRTFRWAMGALVATCCLVAGYGLLQQVVGKYTLVGWGYSFDEQVRSLSNGQLRSFGTLDDPFAYAALLCFGLVAVFFWMRRGPLAWSAAALLLAGVGVSFVRGAVVILIALIGIVLARRGHAVASLLTVTAIVLAGAVILVNASGSQTQTYAVSGAGASTTGANSVNVILNGRISAWGAALGTNPGEWLFGRGVGTVGTAAARATYTLAPSSDVPDTARAQAVDSGYLATIADVGFVGLAVLLALFARIATMALEGVRRNSTPAWVALGLLAAVLLDALARSSFTGFPTAFLGLFLVGISLSAAREADPRQPRRIPAPSG